MTKYVISFPSGVMDVADDEWEQVSEESRAVIREIKAAGAYIFGGGIDEDVEPVSVGRDGTVGGPVYPDFDGGYTIIDVATRDEALHWAHRIAVACRCPQEVRQFQYDPES
jgi:hypothetical protein